MKKKNNIILIGFMGVGKGTVARALYEETGLFAIDCDDMIQSIANMKIKKIFEKFGEEHFRKLEKNLANFLLNGVDNAIISTGGGFYKVENLNELGTVVYLKAEFDYIIKRLENSKNASAKFKKRPLLLNLQNAKKIHQERDPLYEAKADFVVNVENKTPKEIVKEIKTLIKDKI
ncbi:shikimate kinase [Campylobacter sputorum]|uniref:shikimate kinase n=1 Tax=Campylobacter sputorum TaxID=206 RepID=UPI001E523859|nr:shikimate kinase [Campylobacter sputorum]